MLRDINMKPIKNHVHDFKGIIVFFFLISVFVPVLIGLEMKLNWAIFFVIIILLGGLLTWFLINELYYYPQKAYGHALDFESKKI